MIQDMTEGSPSRQLWLFSLPLLFSVVFQQLYNIVDSVVAGRFVGRTVRSRRHLGFLAGWLDSIRRAFSYFLCVRRLEAPGVNAPSLLS